jgi:hypothetical protein
VTPSFLFTVAALCASPAVALAQRVITGSVVDSSGAPVAYVSVDAGSRRVIADDSGRFRISLGDGISALQVRRIGFKPVNVSFAAGADTSVILRLEPVARSLEAAIIVASQASRALELRGFYGRYADREKGINAGQFITPEEIEQRSPFRITQMLDGRPGIKTARIARGCTTSNPNLCWAPQGVGGCWMTVYLDGRRLNSLKEGSNTPAVVDEIALPTHIAGIEIYTSPLRAPPQYQSLSGTCGVVLLWSK